MTKKDKIVDKVIYFTKKKYSDYDGYLREDFYRRLQSELLKFQEDGSNINLEVYLMMKSNNLVFKELGSLCNDGNLDLEIELIDKLSPIVKSIFRRMGLSLEKWMELGEDVIIKALETYNGEKTFSLCVVDCIRMILAGKSIGSEYSKEEIYDLAKDERGDSSSLSIFEKAKKFVRSNEVKNDLDILGLIGKKMDILKYVSSEDGSFYDFVYLKYGYWENVYFGVDDICQICGGEDSTIKEYYKQSLELLKKIVNYRIDEAKIFSGNFTYIKKKRKEQTEKKS